MAYVAYIIAFIAVLIPTAYTMVLYITEKDQDYLKAFCLGLIALSSLLYYMFDYKKTCEARRKSEHEEAD